MRVAYFMQFFPGEGAVGTQQPISLAKRLAGRGHKVTVVSADYNIDTNDPEDEVDESVGRGNLRVMRLRSPRGGRGSNLQRLKSYLSFMRAAAACGRRLPRQDVVVGSIQPLFTGRAALSSARRHRCPFVLEVRDLWPDALVVKGAVNPVAAKPLFWLADYLYSRAQRIVSLTPGIKKELASKGVSSCKIDVFPNGFNPELFDTADDIRAEVRRKYEWGNDFVAVYTGSFTKVTAVEVFVRAAARLRDEPGVRFALFGAGPTHAAVKALAAKICDGAVEFHEPVPKTEIPGILAAADVGLMALFETPLIHIYFENKLLDYMGSGLPIVAAFGGEQAELIRTKKVGWVVPSFDDSGFANAVLEARDAPEKRRKMGQMGRSFVHSKLLLPDILDRYCEVIEAAAGGRLLALPAWEPLQ